MTNNHFKTLEKEIYRANIKNEKNLLEIIEEDIMNIKKEFQKDRCKEIHE